MARKTITTVGQLDEEVGSRYSSRRMQRLNRPPLQRIADLSELANGQSVKFKFRQEGVEREGFVASFQGRIVAYENVCRHLPLTLDYGDNKFFTDDRRHFICRTHGAVYEPLTGRCIAGPCMGSSLKALPIQVEKNSVWLATDE